MSKNSKEELLKNKHELEEQLKSVNTSIAEVEYKEKIKEYAPITMEEFNEYMVKFAKYTMCDYYEPWEFDGEDLPGIIDMALRAGIRVKDVDLNPGLRDKVKLADEAALEPKL